MYCQNFSKFNSFENAKKLFLLLLDSVVKSELNFKHSDYLYITMEILLITVILQTGDIIRPHGEPPFPIRADSL